MGNCYDGSRLGRRQLVLLPDPSGDLGVTGFAGQVRGMGFEQFTPHYLVPSFCLIAVSSSRWGRRL
jgi:hypothetical protein